MESIDGSLRRLQTDYVDLYQAHRYDVETPLEETMQAFADVVRQGKALYIGVSEWTADQIRAGHELATDLGIQLISSQPQYSMLWRVIEAEVVPTCRELGISQIVWSPIAQGVLTGKYQPGPGPAGRLAGHRRQGRRRHDQPVHARRRPRRRCSGCVPIAAELDLTPAQLAVAWVLANDNVAAALVGASRPGAGRRERQGQRGRDPGRADGPHRRGARRRRAERSGADHHETSPAARVR